MDHLIEAYFSISAFYTAVSILHLGSITFRIHYLMLNHSY